ncbi:hypothetical protein BST11_19080 [Mycobacterium alsense]|uniref:Transport accessory protein MmpS3 n=1 Tax=Mycobacterium alsense TaxID=324058 RepID=A0ABX3R5C9_9MYCO|nr:MmpS family transport accessory protein [Mycobacterium alsense]OQZ89144.1 hypothetical protein BST11_19080 [Mycobacterium alsense]
MSGPKPPGWQPGDPDSASDSVGEPAPDSPGDVEPFDDSAELPAADQTDQTGQTDAYSRAYSAPEAEQFLSGPYLPADLRLYDYDSYDESADADDEHRAPRWPWVVGVAAIVAAVALVVAASLLVTRTGTNKLANPATTTMSPPPTTTPTGPRQVTYSVTGTKAPGDIISVTYVDASGRSRTQHNVYIPWSMTVTPISTSDVGSVQASSLFRVSRLNCSITTSDGTVLSSNNSDAPQTSC